MNTTFQDSPLIGHPNTRRLYGSMDQSEDSPSPSTDPAHGEYEMSHLGEETTQPNNEDEDFIDISLHEQSDLPPESFSQTKPADSEDFEWSSDEDDQHPEEDSEDLEEPANLPSPRVDASDIRPIDERGQECLRRDAPKRRKSPPTSLRHFILLREHDRSVLRELEQNPDAVYDGLVRENDEFDGQRVLDVDWWVGVVRRGKGEFEWVDW